MFLALLALATADPATPVISTDSGPVAGETLPDGSAVFRGIPYAQPPVGLLRWKPPQSVQPWQEVREATQNPPACPQPDQGWNAEAAARTSEDCLYLDVRTPDIDPEQPMPVMVWIHGGANLAGSGAGTVMSSIPTHGVVLVAVQYRLGPLGFLSHPALSAESENGTSGNYALMDHQAALRWVKTNIARFGGDPDNITIFGESAGAQNVGLLMLAPGGRGLFHKAIAESGTASFGSPARSLADNETIGVAIAAAAGVDEASAEALRSIPAERLIEITTREGASFNGTPAPTLWVTAVVDGAVLPEAPADTLKRGGQARVPLVIGANAKEFAFGNVEADPIGSIRESYGAQTDAALRFYGLNDGARPAEDPRLGNVAMQISSDLAFRCPMIAVSKAHAWYGIPIWQYHFDYAPPEGPPVAHASELPYVFNAPGEEGLAENAAPLQAYWVNFAKTGNPNGGELPDWPRYNLEMRPYLSFEVGGPEVKTRLRDAICNLRDLP